MDLLAAGADAGLDSGAAAGVEDEDEDFLDRPFRPPELLGMPPVFTSDVARMDL